MVEKAGMSSAGVSSDDVQLRMHTQCTVDDRTAAAHKVSYESHALNSTAQISAKTVAC